MSADDALMHACRETFFAANQNTGKGWEQISYEFEVFWLQNKTRMCDMASRCTRCLGFHPEAETCDEYRASAIKREAERQVQLAEFPWPRHYR